MKPVAVIILNWNGERLLSEYLPEVIKNTNPDFAEIVVADNGSTDGSVALLERDFPEVRLMKFDRNYGFAEGYNRALAATENKYTVLLNSDVAPATGWIEPLVEFMDAHPDVAAVQPKIRSRLVPEKFEYAGACGGFLDINGYPYCRGRIFDTVETDNGQYDEPMEIFWASGAALFIRTELYNRAGGLDPDFFAHMEEIDLCWRLKLAGYSLYAVPASTVYHLGGASLDYSNPRKTYLNFRNNLLMLHKNLPDSVRGRKLIVRRLLDTIAWAKYLVTGNFANAGAIWRAHRDFAKMRGRYTSHPEMNLLETMSPRVNILTDYYFRGRKKFSDSDA